MDDSVAAKSKLPTKMFFTLTPPLLAIRAKGRLDCPAVAGKAFQPHFNSRPRGLWDARRRHRARAKRGSTGPASSPKNHRCVKVWDDIEPIEPDGRKLARTCGSHRIWDTRL